LYTNLGVEAKNIDKAILGAMLLAYVLIFRWLGAISP